jgi:hypothetical protein
LILKKALGLVATVAALAAAVAVVVVAAAMALYAILREQLTPAGSAAVLALIAAAISAILAFVAFRQVRPRPLRRDEENLTTRLIDLAREKPVIAAGAAVAAGLVLLRNPGVVTSAITAFMAGRAGGKADARRRRR